MADMNVTPARPGLTPIIWQSDFWVEYLRENQFSVYFGTTMDAMIQLQTDLQANVATPSCSPPSAIWSEQASPGTSSSRATRKSSTPAA